MGILAASVLIVGGLLTLIPGVPRILLIIGLLAIVVGLVLVVTFSFRQARRAQVSMFRAFGRALKDGARALWELVP